MLPASKLPKGMAAAVLAALTAHGMSPWDAAAALVTGVENGVLTVTRNDAGGGEIVNRCTLGNVKINGADPAGGPAACDTITGIVLNGGGGNDNASLAFLTSTAMPALTGATLTG